MKINKHTRVKVDNEQDLLDVLRIFLAVTKLPLGGEFGNDPKKYFDEYHGSFKGECFVGTDHGVISTWKVPNINDGFVNFLDVSEMPALVAFHMNEYIQKNTQKEIKIDDSYVAIVDRDGVLKLASHKISFKILEEIYNAAKDLRDKN